MENNNIFTSALRLLDTTLIYMLIFVVALHANATCLCVFLRNALILGLTVRVAL